MTAVERFVVGVDGSLGSQRALDWAASVAHHASAAIELVHGLSPWAGVEMRAPPVDLGAYRRTISESLEEWTARLGDVEHHVTIVEDEGAHALLSVADRKQADLVVVGSHGKGRWAPHLLGATTSKVLHWAETPVAVIPHAYSVGSQDGRVCAGLDGSASSLRAFRWAAGWAQHTASAVYALCVYPSDPLHAKPQLADGDSTEPESDTLLALRDLAAQVARESKVSIASDVLVGHAAGRLIETAVGEAALVVGGTGHGGLRSVVVGSTSRACATHSRVPTVVVP